MTGKGKRIAKHVADPVKNEIAQKFLKPVYIP